MVLYRVSLHYIFFLLWLGFCFTVTPAGVYAAEQVTIRIEGVSDELLENVKALLTLEQQKNHPQLSAPRIKRLHKQALKEIQQALQPFGFYAVQVTAELTAPTQLDSAWQAHYQIELGKPLVLKTVKIELEGDGEQDSAFQKLLTTFPVKVGETLNHPRYEQGKKALRDLAEERGYLDARFVEQKIEIDEQAYHATVILQFDTGRRYRFGTVKFEQKESYEFDEDFLHRLVTFQPGDFYTQSALLAFKNALTNSDYFESVEVDKQPVVDTEKLYIPIKATLTPRKVDKYSAGIGYGTDTGARGNLGWERRRINRYGHRFEAIAQLSQRRNSITTRYLIPGHTQEDVFAITGGYKDEDTQISESRMFLAGVSKTHARTLLGIKLREINGIEYRDEKYKIADDAGHSRLLMPYVSWTYLQADDRIYATHGQRIQLEIRGTVKNAGSNATFLRSSLSGLLIRKVTDDGRIITRGDVGYTMISLLNGDFRALPSSVRFFAGGDRSVRGYNYKSLGPTNNQNKVIGGRYLLVGSVEYEHRILEKWSVATFFDAGNAFNQFSEPLKKGAGIGLRWHSPVGLIRIDVAAALSKKGNPLHLHIVVGPDL